MTEEKTVNVTYTHTDGNGNTTQTIYVSTPEMQATAYTLAFKTVYSGRNAADTLETSRELSKQTRAANPDLKDPNIIAGIVSNQAETATQLLDPVEAATYYTIVEGANSRGR